MDGRLGHTADEEGVAREDSPAGLVLEEVADAVLRVARRVDALHDNVPDLKGLPVRGGLGDALAVLASDDSEAGGLEFRELGGVSPRPSISTPLYFLRAPFRLSGLGLPCCYCWGMPLTSFLFPPAWSQWLRKTCQTRFLPSVQETAMGS